jgi:acyl-CoA thioesterase YciA
MECSVIEESFACPLPEGMLILRTLAMPADTNVNGDIFGGWIMAQMDIAGSILAKRVTRTRVVTVAVESMKFIKPVQVGDIVSCYGTVVRIGNTSLTLNIDVWVETVLKGVDEICPNFKVIEAKFTYVAVDDKGIKVVFDKD